MHGYIFHAIVISGRIVALCIGCLAMYVAFFLYPDQEGQLQNRIEDFWVTVNDRALQTGSTTVALFNRTANVVQRTFNRIFGPDVFSLRLVIISCTLSLSFIAIPVALGGIIEAYSRGFSRESVEVLFAVLPVTCACVALWRPRYWILLGFALPISFWCVVKLSLVGERGDPFYRFVIILIGSLFGSLVSDVIALTIIKWSLGSIGAQRSLRTICTRLIAVGLIVPASVIVPLLGSIIVGPDRPDAIHNYLWWSFMLIGVMNAATAIYCLIPTGVFLVVLVHRVVWPMLNRLLFPVARFELIKNRKAMAAIGSLAILVGLGLKEATLEAILKLFG